MKRRVGGILLIFSAVGLAQNSIDYDKLKSFNITVNYPEYTIKAQMLKDPAKITPDENKTYNWYASNKIMETKGGFDGKLLHGYYKCFFIGGNLKETGEFKYGVKSGKWSSWYTTGVLRDVLYWKNGVKHGKYRLYSETGQLVAEGNFKKDKLDGKFKTFYNGRVEDVKKYKDGVEIIKPPKAEGTSGGMTKTPFKEKLKNLFKKKPKEASSAKEEPTPEKEKPVKEKKEKKPKEKKPKKESKEAAKTVSK